jgi:hypothetical protein
MLCTIHSSWPFKIMSCILLFELGLNATFSISFSEVYDSGQVIHYPNNMLHIIHSLKHVGYTHSCGGWLCLHLHVTGIILMDLLLLCSFSGANTVCNRELHYSKKSLHWHCQTVVSFVDVIQKIFVKMRSFSGLYYSALTCWWWRTCVDLNIKLEMTRICEVCRLSRCDMGRWCIMTFMSLAQFLKTDKIRSPVTCWSTSD